MISSQSFERWIDEFYPDKDALLNNLLIQFPQDGYEIVISKNDTILGEAIPYYCKSERFGIDIYCFVKKAS